MTLLTLCLLVSADTFANSLDPDQAQPNVGPDLYPKYLTHGIPEISFEKVDFENKISRRQKACKIELMISSIVEQTWLVEDHFEQIIAMIMAHIQQMTAHFSRIQQHSQ